MLTLALPPRSARRSSATLLTDLVSASYGQHSEQPLTCSNRLECRQCQMLRDGSHTTYIENCPPYLMVHLCRWSESVNAAGRRQWKKDARNVVVAATFNTGPYMVPAVAGASYHLECMIVHQSADLDTHHGHYVIETLENGRRIRRSDEQEQEITDAFSRQPYILLYRRADHVPRHTVHGGIRNYGNTCFANAAVQLLRKLPWENIQDDVFREDSEAAPMAGVPRAADVFGGQAAPVSGVARAAEPAVEMCVDASDAGSAQAHDDVLGDESDAGARPEVDQTADMCIDHTCASADMCIDQTADMCVDVSETQGSQTLQGAYGNYSLF